MNFLFSNYCEICFRSNWTPINNSRLKVYLVIIHNCPLWDILRRKWSDNLIEKEITSNIDVFFTLDSFQPISASSQWTILNERKYLIQYQSILWVCFSIYLFFVFREYLGQAYRIAAKIVNQHIVSITLFTNITLVVLGTS